MPGGHPGQWGTFSVNETVPQVEAPVALSRAWRAEGPQGGTCTPPWAGLQAEKPQGRPQQGLERTGLGNISSGGSRGEVVADGNSCCGAQRSGKGWRGRWEPGDPCGPACPLRQCSCCHKSQSAASGGRGWGAETPLCISPEDPTAL